MEETYIHEKLEELNHAYRKWHSFLPLDHKVFEEDFLETLYSDEVPEYVDTSKANLDYNRDEKSGFRANRSADSRIVRELDIKVGDILTVRDLKWYDDNKDSEGFVIDPYMERERDRGNNFVSTMAEQYCGKRVVVVEIIPSATKGGTMFHVDLLKDSYQNPIVVRPKYRGIFNWTFKSWMFEECYSRNVVPYHR